MTPERLAEIRACCEFPDDAEDCGANECVKCGDAYICEDGLEPTPLCNLCAQSVATEMVPELIQEIERLRAEVEQLASDNAGLSRDLSRALQ